MSRSRPNYVAARVGQEALKTLAKMAEETPNASVSWTINCRVGLAVDIMVEALAEQRSMSNMVQLLCHEALTAREVKAEADGKAVPAN